LYDGSAWRVILSVPSAQNGRSLPFWRPFPLSDRSPPYNSGRRSDGMQIWVACWRRRPRSAPPDKGRATRSVRGVGWPRHAVLLTPRAHPSTSSPRTKPTTAPRSDHHDLSLLNEVLREVVRSRGPARCRPQRRRPRHRGSCGSALACSIGHRPPGSMSFIVLPLPPPRAAVAGSRAYRKWRGAAPLRGR
jgi:hypothetical protein